MKVTVHHFPDGTFAVEIPTESGEPQLVFSAPLDDNAGRIDHYTVLAAALLRLYGLILPPISKTKLISPGEDTVPARFAG